MMVQLLYSGEVYISMSKFSDSLVLALARHRLQLNEENPLVNVVVKECPLADGGTGLWYMLGLGEAALVGPGLEDITIRLLPGKKADDRSEKCYFVARRGRQMLLTMDIPRSWADRAQILANGNPSVYDHLVSD